MNAGVISWLNPLLALALSPLLLGIVNRTKAFFSGRCGPGVLQLYYDLAKLLRKGAVYSRTTSWVFRFGPVVGFAALVLTAALVPMASIPAPLAFEGDIIVLASALALSRFVTVTAALDTGSSFEGMGASREAVFSALAEPALFIALAVLAKVTGAFSLSALYLSLDFSVWIVCGTSLVLVFSALVIVFLTENARIPIDDPNTHLELTMIHEAMVLDHGGPDYAFILYGAALKFWVLGTLVVQLIFPFHSQYPWLDLAGYLSGMFIMTVAVGVIESTLARLRLLRIGQLLVGALTLAVVALMLAGKSV